MIWATPDTTLVEYLPIFSTNSLFHLVLSFGQSYLPFALTHDFKDAEFNISEAEIDSTLRHLDSVQMKFKSLS